MYNKRFVNIRKISEISPETSLTSKNYSFDYVNRIKLFVLKIRVHD